MASTAHIDGALPDGSAASTTSLVFSRGWAVQYDWVADRALEENQPWRLRALGFPAPFDSDLDGVLRGRGPFSDFLFLFKDGQYLRLRESTLTPDGPPAGTALNWDLPAHWTTLDAVFPGGGLKGGFAYFFRGSEYCRFDWASNGVSPGYPKDIASNWHTAPPFTRDFDGAIVGQGRFSAKAYLFKTIPANLDDEGSPVPPGTAGSRTVKVPAYVRYDFDTEIAENTLTSPVDLAVNWPGLLPLLDAGPAIDLAIRWCDRTLAELAGGLTPAMSAAWSHHFKSATPSALQFGVVTLRIAAVRACLATLPTAFQWSLTILVAAETVRGVSMKIGDGFSLLHGPNGRAAVLVHEAVHFTDPGGPAVDVPEWSGETINGVTRGLDPKSGMAYASMTADQALTNPGSYASFVQEIALASDTRFGGGRPHE